MIMLFDKHDSTEYGETSRDTPAPMDHPSDGDIRVCAYHMYESDGRLPGRTLVNWLAAEAQLRRKARQAIWLIQERQRRREMFPRVFRREDCTIRRKVPREDG